MDRIYWYWLRSLKYQHIEKLTELAGSLEELFAHPELIREAHLRLRTATVDKLIRTADPDLLLGEIRSIEQKDVSVVTYGDAAYPDLLKRIYDPPRVLYVRGDLGRLTQKPFAMVGTRRATRSGMTSARRIARELSENGVSVISGMARGIDTAAAVGGIEGGSPTCAVLGCGPDIIYPRENDRIYHKILETGVVISEYPPETAPLSSYFPARNRIISGLSQGVLIVEGELNSGASITMRYALEENRDVFAMPGDLNNPVSALPNQLISEGAQVCIGADSILEYYGWKASETHASKEKNQPKLDFSEQELYTLLKQGDCDIDYLVAQTGRSVSDISLTLTMLELKGYLVRLPGNRVGIKP